MNREQAKATVAKFLHSHGLVSALVALGLLKLDDAVADDLAKAGFRIVRVLKADSATIAFSANADGSLRVRYAGWEEAKVLRPGESIELVTRKGQVWAYRRGEPLKGPAPDPYKDWVGTAKMTAGQNDRGAKGV